MDWTRHMNVIRDIITDNACSFIFKIQLRSRLKVITSQYHADVQWMEVKGQKQKDFVTQLLELNHMPRLCRRWSPCMKRVNVIHLIEWISERKWEEDVPLLIKTQLLCKMQLNGGSRSNIGHINRIQQRLVAHFILLNHWIMSTNAWER